MEYDHAVKKDVFNRFFTAAITGVAARTYNAEGGDGEAHTPAEVVSIAKDIALLAMRVCDDAPWIPRKENR